MRSQFSFIHFSYGCAIVPLFYFEKTILCPFQLDTFIKINWLHLCQSISWLYSAPLCLDKSSRSYWFCWFFPKDFIEIFWFYCYDIVFLFSKSLIFSLYLFTFIYLYLISSLFFLISNLNINLYNFISLLH